MDLWTLNLSSRACGGGGGAAATAARGSGWGRRNVLALGERRRAWWRGNNGSDGGNGVLQMWGPTGSGMGRGYHGEVRASGKKKGHGNSPPHDGSDPSLPEGDDCEGGNSVSDETKPDDTSVQKSHHLNSDWRTFRANLVAQEKGLTGDSDLLSEDLVSQKQSSKLGSKWAHPIPVPEAGCVLIATDKLDGVRTFERTVVLLLRIGTSDPREGPFGIILNRPLNKKIKHMKPTNPDLATTFAECSLHFGGPLDASMFLLRTSDSSPVPSFEHVVPGICFGTRNGLDEAAGLVKRGIFRPQDFQFFVGYAGWQVDQLREEIASDFWIVAACSSDLLGNAILGSSSGLWEEVLLLMGDRYTDLCRKSKEDEDS